MQRTSDFELNIEHCHLCSRNPVHNSVHNSVHSPARVQSRVQSPGFVVFELRPRSEHPHPRNISFVSHACLILCGLQLSATV